MAVKTVSPLMEKIMRKKIFKLALLCAVVWYGVSCDLPEGPNVGAKSNTGTETGSNPAEEIRPESGKEAVSESGKDAGANTGPETGTETGAGTEANTGPKTGAGTEANTEAETGTLILHLPGKKPAAAGRANSKADSLADDSRSVLSNEFIGELQYRITLTHSAGGVVSLEAGGGETEISLKVGVWDIDVDAYDTSDPAVVVGSGSASVTIAAGEPATPTISMYVDPFYENDLTEVYIHNEEELLRIGAADNGLAIDNPDRTFYLEADIELTDPWTPIGGSSDYPFRAIFDGGGHTITINGFDEVEPFGEGLLGLFGYTDEGAAVKNLKVQCNFGDSGNLPEFSDIKYAGAVAGVAEGSDFENITVSGFFGISVTHSNSGENLYFGGIAGKNVAGTIRSCQVNAVLIAKGKEANTPDVYIGGVAGENLAVGSGGIIEKSSFTGNLKGNGYHSIYAGGIAGNSNVGSKITDSYTAGIVEGVGEGISSHHSYAGGIAGKSDGTIENCYAWANVHSGTDYQQWAGGIAGVSAGDISKCYAAGTVRSDENGGSSCVGGIAGEAGSVSDCIVLVSELDGASNSSLRNVYAIASSGSLSNNYALEVSGSPGVDFVHIHDNTNTSDQGSGYDNTARDGAIRTLNEFKVREPSWVSIYITDTGWDFPGVWTWIDGWDYPVLSWQEAAPGAGMEEAIVDVEIGWL
jgi:hypothetical protein